MIMIKIKLLVQMYERIYHFMLHLFKLLLAKQIF